MYDPWKSFRKLVSLQQGERSLCAPSVSDKRLHHHHPLPSLLSRWLCYERSQKDHKLGHSILSNFPPKSGLNYLLDWLAGDLGPKGRIWQG